VNGLRVFDRRAPEQFVALVREGDEHTSTVISFRCLDNESATHEPVDETTHARLGDQQVVVEIAHTRLALWLPREVEQHVVLVERKVAARELPLELPQHRNLRSKQRFPRVDRSGFLTHESNSMHPADLGCR